MIYLVMIDGLKLTEPQHHRLLDEILRLGNGTGEIVDRHRRAAQGWRAIVGDLRDTVPPLPLKWNAVDATFEAVRARINVAVDDLVGMPPRFPRPVICAWCGNQHRAAVPFETTTQGDNCAAIVFQATAETIERLARAPNQHEQPPSIAVGEWLINGYYGSSGYDTELWRFVKNAPTSQAKPVCDNCIGERIFANELVRIEGHYP